jgi:hypothetical protein
MTDHTGQLTPEELQKVKDWLIKFKPGGDAICPICGSSEWFISAHLVQPVTLGVGFAIQLGGIGYPQVMMNSNPCGYTMFLNAVMIGILPSAPIPSNLPLPVAKGMLSSSDAGAPTPSNPPLPVVQQPK